MSQADAGAGVRLAGVVMLQKRNKAAWNRDNWQKKRAGNLSDDDKEPALLGVKRARRSAKKVEIKNRTWSGCEDSYTESLCCDSAFDHKKKFYIFKFPKRFSEIS